MLRSKREGDPSPGGYHRRSGCPHDRRGRSSGRHRLAMLPQYINMTPDRFHDVGERLLARISARCATGQVRNPDAETAIIGGLNVDGVLHRSHFSSPACRRIERIVPGATSRLSLPPPGIVTTPGFVGCLKCGWLPFGRTCTQPSSPTILIRSRNFTRGGYQIRRSCFAIPSAGRTSTCTSTSRPAFSACIRFASSGST